MQKQEGREADTELPSSQLPLPFEIQRPISHVDFFSTKESEHNDFESRLSPHGSEVPDEVHDFFEQENLCQQQDPSGSDSWSVMGNSWLGNNGQNDQFQSFYPGNYGSDAVNARNYFPLKAVSSGVNTRMNCSGSTSSQMPNPDLCSMPMHSFLATTVDPTDNRKLQVGSGLRSAHVTSSLNVTKCQPSDFDGLLNGPSPNLLKSSHTVSVDGKSLLERHLPNVNKFVGQDAMQSPLQFFPQNLEESAHLQGPVGYDFLGGQFFPKGQGQGTSTDQSRGARRQLGLGDTQLWQDQALHLQQLQDWHRYQQAQQLKPHSQQARQHQMHQFLVGQMQTAVNPYSTLLQGSTMHDLSHFIQANGGLTPICLDNHTTAFLSGNNQNTNLGSSGWPTSVSSLVQGLASDFLMGQDRIAACQTLASKGLQLDPPLCGSLTGSSRDATGQMLAFHSGFQNVLQEHYGGAGKLPAISPVGKPVPWSFSSGSSLAGDTHTEFFSLTNAQNKAAQGTDASSKHQHFGNPFLGKNLQQSILQPPDQSQLGIGLYQMNPPSDFQAKLQRNWTNAGQKPDTLVHHISQTPDVAENFPQNFLNNYSLQQVSHQNGDSCQPVSSSDARSSRIGNGQFMQQNKYQISDDVGSKHENGCCTPSVAASVECSNVDNELQQTDAWSSLHCHQSQNDSGSALQLLPNAERNIWGTNKPHTSSSLAGSSFHLFHGPDSRQSEVQNAHDSHQGSKAESSLPGVLVGGVTQVNEKASHSFADVAVMQDERWKEQGTHNGSTKTGNGTQSLTVLGDQSRTFWENHNAQPSAAGAGVQLPDVDAVLHNSSWAQNLHKGNFEAETSSRILSLTSSEQNNWHMQAPQLSQQTRDRLLTNVDTGQQLLYPENLMLSGNSRTVKHVPTTGEKASKTAQNTYKDAGSSFLMRISEQQMKTDREAFIGNIQGGVFPHLMTSHVRQSNNQSGSSNEQGTQMTKNALQPASSLTENAPLQQGYAQAWGSSANNINARLSGLLDGNSVHEDSQEAASSPRTGHRSRQQTARVGYFSPSSSPQREKENQLEPFINSNLRIQSRLKRMNMDDVESLPDKFLSSGTFSETIDALEPQRHLRPEKAAILGGTSQSVVHIVEAPCGADMRQLKLSGAWSMAKDLQHSKSQAYFNSTSVLNAVSLSGVISTSPPSSEMGMSGADNSSVDEASLLSRSTLELLSKPRQSMEKLSLCTSVPEEQRGLSNEAEETTSSISLAHFRRGQLPSPSSPQSIGLGLAPPSHLSQILQQGCTSGLGNYVHVHGLESRLVGSGMIGKDQPFQAQCGYDPQSERVEKAGVSHASIRVLGADDRPTRSSFATESGQTPSLPSTVSMDGINFKHLSSSAFSGGQSIFGIAGNDTPPSQPGSTDQNAQEMQTLNASMQQTGENRAVDFSRLSMSFKNSVSGQHRVFVEADKKFPGVFESFCRLPSARPTGMVKFKLDSQVNLGMSSNEGKTSVLGHSQLLQASARAVDEGSNLTQSHNRKSPKQTATSELASADCQLGFQEQRASSPALVPSSLLEKQTSPLKSSSSLPQHTSTQLQEVKRLSLEKTLPLSVVEGRLAQQQTDTSSEVVLLSQTSESLAHSDTHGFPSSEPAATAATLHMEASRKPPRNSPNSKMIFKGNLSQQPPHPHGFVGQGKASAGKGGVQQHIGASDSLSKHSQRYTQEREKSLHGYIQLQNQALNNLLTGASQMSSMANGVRPTHLFAEATSSFAYSEKNDEHLLISHENLNGVNGAQFLCSKQFKSHTQGSDKLPLGHSRVQNQALNSLLTGPSQMSSTANSLSPTHLFTGATSSLAYSEKNDEHLLISHKNLNGVNGAQALCSKQFLSKVPDRLISGAGQSSCFAGGMRETFLKEGKSRLLRRNTTALSDRIPELHTSCLRHNFRVPDTVLPKKRKKLGSPPIPWHVMVMQPESELLSTSTVELKWAFATNRLPERDDQEAAIHDELIMTVARAKRRLKLSTKLMQQLIAPVSATLMHGNTVVDYECAAYTLAKMNLADACRLIAGTGRASEIVFQNEGESNMNARKDFESHMSSIEGNEVSDHKMMRRLEEYLEKVKWLEGKLVRLENANSAMELTSVTHDLEKLSVVNRLAKYHGMDFTIESSENYFVKKEASFASGTGVRRPFPQKYVTAVPMPRMLPEGVKCLSL